MNANELKQSAGVHVLPGCTRFEVVDDSGLVYRNTSDNALIAYSIHDDGRRLTVFVCDEVDDIDVTPEKS